MSRHFRLGLLDSDGDVPCPNCKYPFWIRLVEVVARCAVICPVCRCQVRLNDADGSVRNAAIDMQNAIIDDPKLTTVEHDGIAVILRATQ